MSDAKSKLTLVGILSTLLAGCSWDNSPPPFHSVITFDPSRARTYISNVPTTNTPYTSEWKSNQITGVGYGYSGSAFAPATGAAVGGAVSSPSGVSSGTASGTTSAASGTPGALIATPTGTSITGTSPSTTTTLPGPITPSQPAPATGSAVFAPTPLQYPASTTPSGIGVTNTSSGVVFTNRYTPPTNTFPIPGINPRLNSPTP